MAAATLLNVADWQLVVLVGGYYGFSELDRRLDRKAKTKAIEDELYGWEKDPDDPENEIKGEIGRIRLPQTEQIVVTRIADIIRRTL